MTERSGCELTCMDCGQRFTFTAPEQELFDRKGFKERPRRCKPCRAARRNRRDAEFMPAASGGDGPAPSAGGRDDDNSPSGSRSR